MSVSTVLSKHAYTTWLVESIKLINVTDPSRNKTPLVCIPFPWLSCKYIDIFRSFVFQASFCNKMIENFRSLDSCRDTRSLLSGSNRESRRLTMDLTVNKIRPCLCCHFTNLVTCQGHDAVIYLLPEP